MSLRRVRCQIEYEGRGVGRFVEGTIPATDIFLIRGYYGVARLKASSFRKFAVGDILDVEIQLSESGKCYLLGARLSEPKTNNQTTPLQKDEERIDFRPSILSLLKQRVEQLSDPTYGFFI